MGQGRATIAFRVSAPKLADDESTGTVLKWLTVDGAWTDAEEDGIEFTLYRSATPLERHRMDERIHEYAGGLSPFIEMQTGITNAQQVILAQIEAELWPDGRPEADADDEYLKQTRLIDDAWRKHDSPAMGGWRILTSLRDRLAFLSAWAVLGIEHPEGWADLGDREIDDPDFYAITRSYNAARAEIDAAKTPSSKP